MSNLAHYRGDVTDFDPSAYMGADTAGAFYRPIEAAYDAVTNRTTIKFRPIPPADMPQYAESHMEQMYRKAELMAIYGGHW